MEEVKKIDDVVNLVPVPPEVKKEVAFDHSNTIVDLAKALALAQSEIRAAKKTKINPYFKSKYADLDEVWDACRVPLSKNGLSVIQTVATTGQMVSVTTILLHSSGEYITGCLTLQADSAKPQPIGSAITYARRYGLSAMVGISADEDSDGSAANGRKVNTELPETQSRLDAKQQKAIKNELQRVGEGAYYKLLGAEFGCTTWEEISDPKEAERFISELGKLPNKKG